MRRLRPAGAGPGGASATLATLLCLSQVAAADTESESRPADSGWSLEVTYDVVAECPDRSEFLALLARELDNSDSTPVRAEVRIRSEPTAGYELVVENWVETSRATSRQSSDSCELLVAKAASLVGSGRSSQPPWPGFADPHPSTRHEGDSQPTEVEDPDAPAPPSTPESDPPPPPTPATTRARYSLGALGEVDGGSVLGTSWSTGLSFRYGLANTWQFHARATRWFSRSTQLSFNGRLPTPATFDQVALAAGGCASHPWWLPGLRVEACGSLGLHRLQVDFDRSGGGDSSLYWSLGLAGGVAGEAMGFIVRAQIGARLVPDEPRIVQRPSDLEVRATGQLQPTAELSLALPLGG